MAGRRVTHAASLIRETSPQRPQKQSDPEGGIPSGSLEVLGRKTKSAGAGLAVEGDNADLRGILVAAIDHLLAHEHGAGVVVSAGRYVLAGQRGEGADRAERDDEKAKRRLQHFSRSPSAWLVMIGITGEFFRVMSPIVSIVSPGLIFRQKLCQFFCGRNTCNQLNWLTFNQAARLSTPAPLTRSASCLRA